MTTKSSQACYPLPQSRYLRMLPDHTGLLEEGEAFITNYSVIDPRINSNSHIICFRSPSYFGGDLVKMKLANSKDLLRRASERKIHDKDPLKQNSEEDKINRDCYDVIESLRSPTLLLSTKGQRSLADMMSGGDFDGDKSYVCWDEDLTKHITEYAAEETSKPSFKPLKPPDNIEKLCSHATLFDRANYARHFKKHQRHLGLVSNMLDFMMDKFGVDSSEAKMFATEGFLQVSIVIIL